MKNNSSAETSKPPVIIKTMLIGAILLLTLYVLLDVFYVKRSHLTHTSEPTKVAMPVTSDAAIATSAPVESVVSSPLKYDGQDDSQARYFMYLDELRNLQIEERMAKVDCSIKKLRLERLQIEKKIIELDKTTNNSVAIEAPSNDRDVLSKEANLPPAQHYKVLYITNENGRWRAVLALSDVMYQVTLGTLLPDGSCIKNITATTLTLENLQGQETLSMGA